MKHISFLFLCIIFSAFLFGQKDIKPITDSIVKEGKALYRSEMASWYGTDIFLEKFKNKKDRAGGYFSYADKDIARCIFFSDEETPKVLATISFDSTYSITNVQTDDTERDFTNEENDLYTIRKLALAEINKDKLFKTYENTNLNLVPLISNNERKVYVLTGSQLNDVVFFGNDYLLRFDNNNNIVSKKRLHRNMIEVKYGKLCDKNVVGTMHTHLPETGDFITATDICTLMLYEKIAGWKQHIVISQKYISIWNCENDVLIVTKKD